MFEQLVENCCITTVLYLTAFGLYSLFSKQNNKIQVCDIVLIIFLVVATGIRYDVGADWQQYYSSFSNLLATPGYFNTIYSWYGLDSGFWYLMAAIGTLPFGDSPYALFWVVSLLTYPAVVLYFRKKTASAPWAFAAYIFLGFFGSSINVLRHTLAAVSFLWAFEARVSKRYLAFIVLSLLAIVFHSSVLFALATSVFAYRRKPSVRLLLSCIVAGVACLLMFRWLFALLVGFLPFLARFQTTIDSISGDLDRQYMWIVSFIYFALATIVVCVYLWQTRSDTDRDVRMDSLVSSVCIALIPNVVSFAIWPVDRMAFFIFLLLIALVPQVVQRNPKLQVPVLLAMCVWHVPYALFSWDNVNAFTSYLL